MTRLDRKISGGTILTKEEESDLVAAWRTRRDEAALEELCRRFEPLVRSICARRARLLPHDENSDVFQLGRLGFLEALGRFDPDRGFRLATYAAPWIENVVRHGAFDLIPWRKTARIRLGVPKAAEAHRRLLVLKGRVTDEDREAVALESNLSPAEQDFLLSRLSPNDVSLSTAPTRFEGEERGDGRDIPDPSPSPEEQAWTRGFEGEKAAAFVEDLLADLPEIERSMLRKAFLDPKSPTLAQVAASFGISRQYALDIRNRGLRALRARLEKEGWAAADVPSLAAHA